MLQLYGTPSYERCILAAGEFINSVMHESTLTSNIIDKALSNGNTIGAN